MTYSVADANTLLGRLTDVSGLTLNLSDDADVIRDAAQSTTDAAAAIALDDPETVTYSVADADTLLGRLTDVTGLTLNLSDGADAIRDAAQTTIDAAGGNAITLVAPQAVTYSLENADTLLGRLTDTSNLTLNISDTKAAIDAEVANGVGAATVLGEANSIATGTGSLDLTISEAAAIGAKLTNGYSIIDAASAIISEANANSPSAILGNAIEVIGNFQGDTLTIQQKLDFDSQFNGFGTGYAIADTKANILDGLNNNTPAGALDVLNNAVSISLGAPVDVTEAGQLLQGSLTLGFSIEDAAHRLLTGTLPQQMIDAADAITVTAGAAGELNLTEFNELQGITTDDSWAYDLAVDKNEIFEGAAGTRSFQDGIKALLDGAGVVKVNDQVTAEEIDLLGQVTSTVNSTPVTFTVTEDPAGVWTVGDANGFVLVTATSNAGEIEFDPRFGSSVTVRLDPQDQLIFNETAFFGQNSLPVLADINVQTFGNARMDVVSDFSGRLNLEVHDQLDVVGGNGKDVLTLDGNSSIIGQTPSAVLRVAYVGLDIRDATVSGFSEVSMHAHTGKATLVLTAQQFADIPSFSFVSNSSDLEVFASSLSEVVSVASADKYNFINVSSSALNLEINTDTALGVDVSGAEQLVAISEFVGTFDLVDTAQAIQAVLDAGDPNGVLADAVKIDTGGTPVDVSLAQHTSFGGKLLGGYNIVDTANSLQAAIDASLTDAVLLGVDSTISASDGALTLSVAEHGAYGDKIDTAYRLDDTAVTLQAFIDAIVDGDANDANLAALSNADSITANAALDVTVAEYKAFGDKLDGATPYNIVDAAAAIQAEVDAGDPAGILAGAAVVTLGTEVTIQELESLAASNQSLGANYQVVDTAANIEDAVETAPDGSVSIGVLGSAASITAENAASVNVPVTLSADEVAALNTAGVTFNSGYIVQDTRDNLFDLQGLTTSFEAGVQTILQTADSIVVTDKVNQDQKALLDALAPSVSYDGGFDDGLPTIAISAVNAPATILAGETVSVEFVLSEPSANFVRGDVVVTGGTLGDLSTTDNQTFTSFISPNANEAGTLSIRVNNFSFTDAVGNFNKDGAEADNKVEIAYNTFTFDAQLTPVAAGNDQITFAAIANGDLAPGPVTVTWDATAGASALTFSKGGLSSTVTPTGPTEIVLATGQTLEVTAADIVGHLANVTGTGTGEVVLLDSTVTAAKDVYENKIDVGSVSSVDVQVTDTADEILGNPGGFLNNADVTSVDVTGNDAGALSVQEVSDLAGLTTDDTWAYSLDDTASNLFGTTNQVLRDATSITVSDAANVQQAERFVNESGASVTFDLQDTATNVAARSELADQAGDITLTTAASVAEAQNLFGFNNSGALVYASPEAIEDTAQNLLAADAAGTFGGIASGTNALGLTSSDSIVIENDAAGELTVAQYNDLVAIVGAPSVANWTYSIIDTPSVLDALATGSATEQAILNNAKDVSFDGAPTVTQLTNVNGVIGAGTLTGTIYAPVADFASFTNSNYDLTVFFTDTAGSAVNAGTVSAFAAKNDGSMTFLNAVDLQGTFAAVKAVVNDPQVNSGSANATISDLITVTEANEIAGTTNKVTATVSTTDFSTLLTLNEAVNDYTITVNNGGSESVSDLLALTAKTVGTVTLLNKATISGDASDLTALLVTDGSKVILNAGADVNVTAPVSATVGSAMVTAVGSLAGSTISFDSGIEDSLANLAGAGSRTTELLDIVGADADVDVVINDASGTLQAAEILLVEGATTGTVEVSGAVHVIGNVVDMTNVLSSVAKTAVSAQLTVLDTASNIQQEIDQNGTGPQSLLGLHGGLAQLTPQQGFIDTTDDQAVDLTVAEAGDIAAALVDGYVLKDNLSALNVASPTIITDAAGIELTDTTVKAADLNALDADTSTVIDATSVQTLTGSAAAVITALKSSEISNLSDENVTLDDQTLSVSYLNNLTALNKTNFATIDAASVQTLTGFAADVDTLLTAGVVSNLGDEAVILADKTLAAADLNALNSNTTGVINAAGVNTLTGSTADVSTALTAGGIINLGDEAVTLDDQTLAASDLITLNTTTTGVIDVSGINTLTGTDSQVNTLLGLTSSEVTGLDGVTVELSGTGVAATTVTDILSQIANSEVDLSKVTELTGTLSELGTAINDNNVKNIPTNLVMKITDASGPLSAADISALAGTTSGAVRVQNAVEVSGTQSEVKAALIDDGVLLDTANTTVTVTDAVTAAQASAIAGVTNADAEFSGGISDGYGDLLDGSGNPLGTFDAASREDGDVNITINDSSHPTLDAADLVTIDGVGSGTVTILHNLGVFGSQSAVTNALVTGNVAFDVPNTVTVTDAATAAQAAAIAGVTNANAEFSGGISDTLANLASGGVALQALTNAADDDSDVAVTITDANGSTLAAEDLLAVEAATSGVVDASGVTSLTVEGSIADLSDLLAADTATPNKLDLPSGVSLSVTNSGTVAAATLTNLATGAAPAAIDASSVTKLTGTLAEVDAVLKNSGITNIATDIDIEITDQGNTQLSAFDLAAIGSATTGTVEVTEAVIIQGDVADMKAALITQATEVVVSGNGTIANIVDTSSAIQAEIDTAGTNPSTTVLGLANSINTSDDVKVDLTLAQAGDIGAVLDDGYNIVDSVANLSSGAVIPPAANGVEVKLASDGSDADLTGVTLDSGVLAIDMNGQTAKVTVAQAAKVSGSGSYDIVDSDLNILAEFANNGNGNNTSLGGAASVTTSNASVIDLTVSEATAFFTIGTTITNGWNIVDTVANLDGVSDARVANAQTVTATTNGSLNLRGFDLSLVDTIELAFNSDATVKVAQAVKVDDTAGGDYTIIDTPANVDAQAQDDIDNGTDVLRDAKNAGAIVEVQTSNENLASYANLTGQYLYQIYLNGQNGVGVLADQVGLIADPANGTFVIRDDTSEIQDLVDSGSNNWLEAAVIDTGTGGAIDLSIQDAANFAGYGGSFRNGFNIADEVANLITADAGSPQDTSLNGDTRSTFADDTVDGAVASSSQVTVTDPVRIGHLQALESVVDGGAFIGISGDSGKVIYSTIRDTKDNIDASNTDKHKWVSGNIDVELLGSSDIATLETIESSISGDLFASTIVDDASNIFDAGGAAVQIGGDDASRFINQNTLVDVRGADATIAQLMEIGKVMEGKSATSYELVYDQIKDTIDNLLYSDGANHFYVKDTFDSALLASNPTELDVDVTVDDTTGDAASLAELKELISSVDTAKANGTVTYAKVEDTAFNLAADAALNGGSGDLIAGKNVIVSDSATIAELSAIVAAVGGSGSLAFTSITDDVDNLVDDSGSLLAGVASFLSVNPDVTLANETGSNIANAAQLDAIADATTGTLTFTAVEDSADDLFTTGTTIFQVGSTAADLNGVAVTVKSTDNAGTVTGAATLAQIDALQTAVNSGSVTYTAVADTIDNIRADLDTATGGDGDANGKNVRIVDATKSGSEATIAKLEEIEGSVTLLDYGIRDDAANIVDASDGSINDLVQDGVDVYIENASFDQVSAITTALSGSETETFTYSILDTGANIANADASILANATEVNVSDDEVTLTGPQAGGGTALDQFDDADDLVIVTMTSGKDTIDTADAVAKVGLVYDNGNETVGWSFADSDASGTLTDGDAFTPAVSSAVDIITFKDGDVLDLTAFSLGSPLGAAQLYVGDSASIGNGNFAFVQGVYDETAGQFEYYDGDNTNSGAADKTATDLLVTFDSDTSGSFTQSGVVLQGVTDLDFATEILTASDSSLI